VQQPRGPHPLSYEDALRALGATADGWDVPTLRLWIGPDGVRAFAPGAADERQYTWPQLIIMTRARARLRNRRPAARQPPPARWEVILRLAGRAMDSHPGEKFTVEAVLGGVGRPASCTVQGPVGPVLTAEECVRQQIEIARYYWRVGRRG
jgi:hypothetical protein